MNKPDILSNVSSFAPRLFQVRGTTWLSLGIGLLVLFGLLIWAAVALLGGLWGQAQKLAGSAPDVLRGTARGALEQVEAIVPGARVLLDQAAQSIPGTREKLAELAPALAAETPPPRDVSGADLGPVVRYPGLTRTNWLREGEQASVEYEGKAKYETVFDHYTNGFVTLGFTQNVLSATPQAESHEYQKGSERFVLKVAKKTKGNVSVRIDTHLPQR